MTLTFLNPLFLFGLAAAVLPILIHRITQKKIKIRKFSAVHLLLQSQQVTARPQRLKHLLVLVLRILAVAAVVLMIARPMFLRPGFATLLKGGAKVLIIDNSMSMGYQEDKGPRYDLAKRAAGEALEGFGGQVAVIPTAGISVPQGQGWMKPEEALKELEGIPLNFGRGDTAAAFSSAYGQLKDLKIPKQVLILSDMVRNDWEALDLTALGTLSDAEITFLRIGTPDRDANFYIKEVSLTEGEAVAGVPARLEVTVSNLSDQAGAVMVQLKLSDIKVGQKSIDLESGQEGRVYFDILIDEPGWIDGEVNLSPDRLSADDAFYFPMKVGERVKVLVVDGDPGMSLRASESYFLVSALRPGGLKGSPFLTQVITETEMRRKDLRSYDAIFLLNVARPDLSRLASFLEMGRPVFLFLGDRIISEAYNGFSLAPWQIGELVDLSGTSERGTGIDRTRGAVDFLKPLEDSLKGASFRTYYKVEGAAENLLTLGNQDPLLVTADAGASRLFLFTSSADLDWNDFPLNAAYLPFLQGLVKSAVGLTGTSLQTGIEVGESFSEGVPPKQLMGPGEGPGIFQFRLPDGEFRRGVNTPHDESDLIKITENELKKKFGEIDVKLLEYEEGGLREFRGGRIDLWPTLLVFLFVVLALEMLMANGFPRFK